MSLAKIFQRGAFRNESGHVGANQAPGWGSVNANTPLGSGYGVPYLSIGKSRTITPVSDNSIVAEGFDDIPRQVTKYAETSISMVNKFDGLNPLLYWAFGLEDEVLPVVCYVCNTPTTEPTAGATYTDPSLNSLTFLRKEVNGIATYYVFTQTAVTAGQTGTLTYVGGGGSNLTFTAHSPLKYEHVFKIDPRERHLVAPSLGQRLAGYTSGDLKCRMALLGVNVDSGSDFVFQNAMCKKFGLSSSAGQMTELNFDFLAYQMAIGDFSSSSWSYPSGVADSDGNILHHNWYITINNVVVGCTSMDLSFDIPLQVIQDTQSGLYLCEPMMEGKYGFTADFTLSRYSSLVWQNLSDAWTEVPARMAAWSGYNLQEFFINNAIVTNADPDDDGVAKQLLKLSLGTSLVNNMNHTGLSITDYSPLMCRVRNDTQTNYMLA